MKSRQLFCAAAALAIASAHAQQPTSNDFWDVSQGAVITADSGIMFGAGSYAGLLGENGQNNADQATWTYFNDGADFDFVHFVEWETLTEVTIGNVRVFAFGDEMFNNGREFETFTLKAKSPGSDIYDITVVDYTATHPFSYVDPFNYLVVDAVVTPVTARQFRAEFTQYTAGFGWDGPRIVEIDGLPTPRPTVNIPPVSDDVWDVAQGAVVTGNSGIHPGGGTLTGMFGGDGHDYWNPNSLTFFADGQPADFVHFVEWETPAAVTVNEIRMYAYGDVTLNNGREVAQVTIKAKSAGSSTYDLTLLTFTPTHPYDLLDPNHFLILKEAVAPVSSRYFRAEFAQYTAGFGWDGPRVVELDAIGEVTPNDPPPPPPPPPPVPPSIVAQPQSVTANYAMPVMLTVQATVTGAAQYQWYKDSVAVAGLTTAGVWIPAMTAADAGVYHVTVTDEVGTVTSAAATVALDEVNILPSEFDLWDTHVGSVATASTAVATGSADAMLGAGASLEAATGFANSSDVHVVEWTTPAAVQVNTIRLHARGDAGVFGSFTLKAKSAGSETFDVTVGIFTPTHPYTVLDETTSAILDTEIEPIVATAFRAEFTQKGESAPSVMELDAFTTRPLVKPAIVVNPASQACVRNCAMKLQVVARGGSLSYQWKFKGVPIPGATSDAYVIASLKQPDEGSYTVVVTNPLGSAESSPAMVTVTNKKGR